MRSRFWLLLVLMFVKLVFRPAALKKSPISLWKILPSLYGRQQRREISISHLVFKFTVCCHFMTYCCLRFLVCIISCRSCSILMTFTCNHLTSFYKNNFVLLQEKCFLVETLSQLPKIYFHHTKTSHLINCNLCASSTLPYHLSVATLHSSVADPDPHKIERHDPDPHQSNKLDLDPDPRQFADDKAKIMEYELILALFQGLSLFL